MMVIEQSSSDNYFKEFSEGNFNNLKEFLVFDLNVICSIFCFTCIDNGYIYSEIWECQWRRGIKAVISIQRLFRNMIGRKAKTLI